MLTLDGFQEPLAWTPAVGRQLALLHIQLELHLRKKFSFDRWMGASCDCWISFQPGQADTYARIAKHSKYYRDMEFALTKPRSGRREYGDWWQDRD